MARCKDVGLAMVRQIMAHEAALAVRWIPHYPSSAHFNHKMLMAYCLVLLQEGRDVTRGRTGCDITMRREEPHPL